MCEQLQRDELEIRATRLGQIGLDLDDRATAALCHSPAFDSICDAIATAIHAAAISPKPRIDFCDECRTDSLYFLQKQPVHELRVGTRRMLLCRKHFNEEMRRRSADHSPATKPAIFAEAV